MKNSYSALVILTVVVIARFKSLLQQF